MRKWIISILALIGFVLTAFMIVIPEAFVDFFASVMGNIITDIFIFGLIVVVEFFTGVFFLFLGGVGNIANADFFNTRIPQRLQPQFRASKPFFNMARFVIAPFMIFQTVVNLEYVLIFTGESSAFNGLFPLLNYANIFGMIFAAASFLIVTVVKRA
mgnify:CR=1 FL=1